MTGWIIFGCIMLFLIWLFTRSVTVMAVYDKDPEIRVKILFFTLVRVPPDPVKQKKKAEKKAAKEAKKARKEAEKAAKQKKGYNSALLRMAEEEEAQNASQRNASQRNAEQQSSAENEQADGGGKNGDKTAKKADKDAYKPPKKKKGLPDINFDMIRDYVASASPPVKRLFKKIRIRDVYIDWVVGSDDAAKTALKYGGLCAAIYSAAEWLRTYLDTKIQEINIEADFSAEKDDIFAYITVKLRISTAIGCALWLGVRMLKTYLKYNSTKKTVKPRPVRARAK